MNPLVFLLALTSLQIEQENTQLTNDLYRLLKKYAGLRNIIRNLKVSTRAFIKFRRFRIWLKSCLNYRIVLWIRRCTQSFLGTPFLRRWSRRRCAIPTTWRSATRPTVEGDDFYEEWSIAWLLGHYASVTWYVCLRRHEWIPGMLLQLSILCGCSSNLYGMRRVMLKSEQLSCWPSTLKCVKWNRLFDVKLTKKTI